MKSQKLSPNNHPTNPIKSCILINPIDPMLVSHHQDLFRPFGPCVPRSDSDVTSHGPAADVTSLADDTAMVMINQKKTDGKTGAHLAWKEINTSVHPEQVYLYGDLGIQYRKKIQNTSFSS